MKKISLSVLLVLVLCTSCSKDDVDNSLPEVTTSKLSGNWELYLVVPTNGVDLNDDGVTSGDLVKEGYNACGYDNTVSITETTFSDILAGVSCADGETDATYQYTFDATEKTLKLFQNGTLKETLEQVFLDDNLNLRYKRYDAFLDQMVYFSFKKMK